MKLQFSRHVLAISTNIKFHENPSSGAEFFLADGWTDMTKLIVAFRNCAKAPKVDIPLLFSKPHTMKLMEGTSTLY